MVIEDKAIGDLTGIDTSLCFTLPADSYGKTYHTDPAQGGCLLDSGVYCASWLEDYTAGTPELQRVYADVRQGVDFYVDASLRFGDMSASLETAFDRSKGKTAVPATLRRWRVRRCSSKASPASGKGLLCVLSCCSSKSIC